MVLVRDNRVVGELEVALRRRRWRQSDLREDIVPTAGWSDSVTDVGEKGRKRLRGGAGPVGARRGGGARRAMRWGHGEMKIEERRMGGFLWRRAAAKA